MEKMGSGGAEGRQERKEKMGAGGGQSGGERSTVPCAIKGAPPGSHGGNVVNLEGWMHVAIFPARLSCSFQLKY